MPRALKPRPIRLPRRIKVAGYWIKVRVARNEVDHDGWYEAATKTIFVAGRLVHAADGTAARETVRHEMLHATFDVTGVGHATAFDEEVVVRMVDQVFFPAWETVRPRL